MQNVNEEMLLRAEGARSAFAFLCDLTDQTMITEDGMVGVAIVADVVPPLLVVVSLDRFDVASIALPAEVRDWLHEELCVLNTEIVTCENCPADATTEDVEGVPLCQPCLQMCIEAEA